MTLPQELPLRNAVRDHGTILVVEDDAAVRRLVLTILQNEGYRTLEAFDGEGGLASFLRHSHDIGLVLTDIVMPHCGLEMAGRILRVDPLAQIAFMSGTAGRSQLPKHLMEYPMLEKPFTAEHLSRFVRQLLEMRRDSIQKQA